MAPALCVDFSVLYSACFPWASKTTELRVASVYMFYPEVRSLFDYALPPGALWEADRFLSYAMRQEPTAKELLDYRAEAWSLRPEITWAKEEPSANNATYGVDRLREYLASCHAISSFTAEVNVALPLIYRYANDIAAHRSDRTSPDSTFADAFNVATCRRLNEARVSSGLFFVLLSDTQSLLRTRSEGELRFQPKSSPSTTDLVIDPLDVLLLIWMTARDPDWRERDVETLKTTTDVLDVVNQVTEAERNYESRLATWIRDNEVQNMALIPEEKQVEIYDILADARRTLDSKLADHLRDLKRVGLGSGKRVLHRLKAPPSSIDELFHREPWHIGFHRGQSEDTAEVVLYIDLYPTYFAARFPTMPEKMKFARQVEDIRVRLRAKRAWKQPKDVGIYVESADSVERLSHRLTAIDAVNHAPLAVGLRINCPLADFWMSIDVKTRSAQAGVMSHIPLVEELGEFVLGLLPDDLLDEVDPRMLTEQIHAAISGRFHSYRSSRRNESP